jgi:hypothetical protein
MRIRSLVAVSLFAVLAAACAPHYHHGPRYGGEPERGEHHGWMSHGCGSGSCTYRSHCFSEGAVRSNDGVCQACSAGRWAPADGCSDHHCMGCMGKDGCMGKGDMPCMHRHGKRGPDHQQ